MNGSTVLLNFAKEIRGATIKRLEEAQQEWMTFAPAGTSNHIAWHAGHVLWVQDYLCVEPLAGESELQDAWADQFGIDCQPVDDQKEWPSKKELLALLKKQDQRIQGLLTEVSEDRLAEIARPEKGDATIAERVAHGLIDEAKHCGEIYLLMKLCK